MKFHFEKILPRPGESFAVEYGIAPALNCLYHLHPECELTCIESGFGCRVIGDSIEPFAAGDLVLIGGMTPHHYLSNPADSTGPEWSRIRVVKFHPEFCGAKLFELPEFAPVGAMLAESRGGGLHFPGNVAEEMVWEMKQLLQQKGVDRVATLWRILGKLARSPRRRLSPGGVPGTAMPDERLERVLRLVHRRIERGEPVPLSEAAAAACLTPPAFSRYFRQTTRKRFVDCVIDLRLSRTAAELVRTGRPILEIALDAGFGNLSNFNRQFRKRLGMTPRTWRERFRIADPGLLTCQKSTGFRQKSARDPGGHSLY